MSATHILHVVASIKVISEANSHTHWRLRQKRAKDQRSAAKRALGPDIKGPPPPYVITLTRIGPRTLDDDNLAGAFKHVRDGVADWLRIDDGDKRLSWRYEQRRGLPKEYAAEIRIEAAMQLVEA